MVRVLAPQVETIIQFFSLTFKHKYRSVYSDCSLDNSTVFLVIEYLFSQCFFYQYRSLKLHGVAVGGVVLAIRVAVCVCSFKG